MVTPVVLGIVCGLAGAVACLLLLLLCRVIMRRKRSSPPPPDYKAIGDYKPISYVDVTPKIEQEEKVVQPKPSLPSSRTASLRDYFPPSDDNSSLSSRSFTEFSTGSFDSTGLDAHLGSIQPDLYQKKDAVLRQESKEKTLGRLHVRLKYDFHTSDLIVHLIEAQDLPSTDVHCGFSDPYVKICLQPEVDTKVRQSSVKRKTKDPVFNEYFKFPIDFDDLRERVLTMYVYDFDKFSRNDVIGEVKFNFREVDVSTTVELWWDIQRQQRRTHDLGELLVSLSYLPTAERLTVVVMKAKELKLAGPTGPSDPFVKASLILDGKRIKKKKTAVRKNTANPVWNEALVFNVPTELLAKVSLELVVADHDLIGHSEVIGFCVLGKELEGEAAAHWTEMLNNFRKAVAKWHPLHLC